MRKCKWMLFTISLILLFGLFCFVDAEKAVAYFAPQPKDITVQISRPCIGMKIILGDNEIESIAMMVDGEKVDATYDFGAEMIKYTPLSALEAGQHAVDLTVAIKGWSNTISQAWNFTVSDRAIEYLPRSTPEQMDSLEVINAARGDIGLGALELSPELNAAATAHANYMFLNNKFSHEEFFNGKAFIGTKPHIRAQAYGYCGTAVSENLCYGDEDCAIELDNLMDAPYHRIVMINPYMKDFGYGQKDKYGAFLFGGDNSGADEIVTYPVNKQKNVPIKWENTEIPDPLRNHAFDAEIGYPVTFSYFSEKKIDRLEMDKAILMDSRSLKVPVYLNVPENDEHLDNSFILIPKDPLEKDRKYTVIADGTVYFEDGSDEPFYKTWYFETELPEYTLFDDIDGHWASSIISQLAEEGIAKAKVGDNFEPDTDITRAEFAELVYHLLGLNGKPYSGVFNDVTRYTDKVKYIEAVYREALFIGDDKGNFAPERTITREEIAMVLSRVYNSNVSEPVVVSDYYLYFKDSQDISGWAESAVKLANKLGIIKGRLDNRFYPKENATRAEAAVMISRLKDVIE